jgi:hypothetical protein
LLGASDIKKFDYLYQAEKKASSGATAKKNDADSSSSEEEGEEEEENQEALYSKLGLEPDDIHSAAKVILQRQFFEAVVRAASVKYSNSEHLHTLAQKLDYLFKNNLCLLAGKNKAKTETEEVSTTSIVRFKPITCTLFLVF